MKHRVKSATSIALAVAMLATSVFSGGGAVFAESEDLVQMETAVEENNVVADSTLAPEITVTDDGISVSDVSDTIEIETVEAQTGAAVSVQQEEISVDNSRLLLVSAFNKSDADCKFRLYFWDGELPEERENWNFSNPNMDVFPVSESEKLTGKLTHQGIVQDVDLHFVEDKTGDDVKARYLLADLPADSSLDFTVRVDANAACNVSAITSVDDALFEGVSLSWATESIVIESETEAEMIFIEPENNDIVMEDSIVIEGGETETETGSAGESGISVESGIHATESETGDSVEMETDAVPSETEAFVDENIETETAAVHTDSISFEEAIAETETAANGVQEIETGAMANEDQEIEVEDIVNSDPEAETESEANAAQDAAAGATADEPDPDGTGIASETDETGENAFAADATEEEISEAVSDSESEFEDETEVVAPEEVEAETEDPELVTEIETGLDVENETEEHFLETSDGVEELNVSDFASMRLVVLASDVDTIIDPEHIIANYDTIYLLQYGSVEQAMNAYVYYLANADAVEPDAVLETASEVLADDDIDLDVTEEQNPILALSEEGDSDAAQKADRVIALIDTGASEGPNIIDRVSLIDDALEGSNSHADDMVSAIVSQNPDARILSIRALGDDGRGTVSSIVAAMEYAINQKVSIINLSLYAKTNLLNSVLESEIQKAVSLGITVVGAAGNDGADAAGYMPGSVAEAWIIGACDLDGSRIDSSNYGTTVDYYVAAGTTSEAAALFTGYVSANGTDMIDVNGGIIYEADHIAAGSEPEVDFGGEDGDEYLQAADDGADDELSKFTLDQYTTLFGYYNGSVSANGPRYTRYRTVTYNYKDDDGNTQSMKVKAYCLQPSMASPSGSSVTYKTSNKNVVEVSDGSVMAKALFYLYGGPMWNKTVEDSDGNSVNMKTVLDKYAPQKSTNTSYLLPGNTGTTTAANGDVVYGGYYALTHFILAYCYQPGSESAWNYEDDHVGTSKAVWNSTGKNWLADIKAQLAKLPEPTVELKRNKATVTSTEISKDDMASLGNGVYQTPTITYDTYEENTAKVTLGAGVTMVYDGIEHTGTVKNIPGGTKFYLKIDTTKLSEDETYTLTFTCKYSVNFQAWKLLTDKAQDIGFYYSTGNKDISVTFELPKKSRILIKKVNGDKDWSDDLIGAKFTLYDGETKLKTVTIKNAEYHEFDYDCELDHTYTIKETKTPDGYVTAEDIQVEVGIGSSYKEEYKYTVKNRSVPEVYVKKVSTASADVLALGAYSIKNAEFGIYTEQACTNKLGTVKTGTDGESGTFKLPCQADGTYTYWVREDKAPAGHKRNTTPKKVTIKLPADADKTIPVEISDDPLFSHISVKKADGRGEWNDSLKGAQFSLYHGGSKLETITINSSDYHTFEYDCRLGETYVVKETKTPDGKIPAEDIPVKIETGTSYKKTYQYTVWNIEPPKVQVTKESTAGAEILGLKSYSVEGAEFGIYTNQACTNKIGTLKTKADGTTESFTLPCETDGTYTYWVREDKAPAGHKQNTTPKAFTVTLPNDDGKTIPVKISDDPDFTEHELNVTKLGYKNELIEGAIFKVEYFDAQLADPSKLVKTWYLRSDKDGIVKMENRFLVPPTRPEYKSDTFFTWNNKIVIPIGGYLRLTEVEAPAEYIVDDTPMGLTTTKTVELEKRFYNEPEPCEIRLKKYDTNGTTPLAGVEFKLTFVSEAVSSASGVRPGFTRLLKVGESTTVKTNSKGEITFSNLDQGTYQITEVSTVSGHTLLKDPIVVTLPIKLSQSEIAAYGNVDTSKGKVDSVTGKTFFYSCLYEITNTPTFKPPMTGSTGTWKYGFIGIAMIAIVGAGVAVHTGRRRKRRIRKA